MLFNGYSPVCLKYICDYLTSLGEENRFKKRRNSAFLVNFWWKLKRWFYLMTFKKIVKWYVIETKLKKTPLWYYRFIEIKKLQIKCDCF